MLKIDNPVTRALAIEGGARTRRVIVVVAAILLQLLGAGCGSSSNPARGAFERAVVAQGFTRQMADCALNNAAQQGLSAKQLLTEWQGIRNGAIPDNLTNVAYGALSDCGVH